MSVLEPKESASLAMPSSKAAQPARREKASKRIAAFLRTRRDGLWRRSLPFSLAVHVGLIVAVFLLFESRNLLQPVEPFHVAALYHELEEVASVELVEEVIEATPELDPIEPEEEPELVESPFVSTVELPLEPEPAQPLDWVPPTDELEHIHHWKLRPQPSPALPPQPVAEAPPPVEAQTPPRDVDEVPEILESPQPRYPRKALRLGWQGTVRLRISVNAAGTVSDVVVVESSGHDSLDEAALEAFRQWVFRPRAAGEPDVRSFEKPFTFRIRDH